jgi:hypothetical protein
MEIESSSLPMSLTAETTSVPFSARHSIVTLGRKRLNRVVGRHSLVRHSLFTRAPVLMLRLWKMTSLWFSIYFLSTSQSDR